MDQEFCVLSICPKFNPETLYACGFFVFFCCCQPKHLQDGFLTHTFQHWKVLASTKSVAAVLAVSCDLPRKQILGEYRAIVRLGETGWADWKHFYSSSYLCAGFVSKAVSISAYS